MTRKQITVIVIVVAISGYLYSLPVKGLIKQKEATATSGHVNGSQPSSTSKSVTIEEVSSPAKTAIGAALTARINDLEGQLKNAPGDADKLVIEKQLAKQWDDDNQPAPSAFYYQSVARKENTFEDWMSAGDHFNDAYKVTRDTAVQPALIANAIEAFENATKLKPDNLDAETGLGVAYANQALSGMMDPSGGPPKGIVILLDVVKKDPGNYKANLNLGQLAVQSRQFDKAVNRFKTAIANASRKENIVEPYFYLAESYKQLGMKKEAIDAYQKCKEMIPDPIVGQKIDQYIKELKN